MPSCTRNGCKKEFSAEENTENSCRYHPGSPVFHEGLKSWSCCSNVNKPELDFDEFMKIQGCQIGSHTAKKEETKATPREVASVTDKDPSSIPTADTRLPPATKEVKADVTFHQPTLNTPRAPPPAPVVEEDDLSVTPVPGTKCRHKGCNAEFISDEESRIGDSQNATCTYHPSPPIFHEGSKGYLCCKRRVLEFEEFLKIEGCTKGKHVFVPKRTESTQTEVKENCRIDHYQTPQGVCVSVFAKKTDKERSSVTFAETIVHLDLFFQGSKRFVRTLNLYGPIVPEESTFQVLGTKVELNLRKKDNRSWNLLEQTNYDLAGFNLTFGVGGRTGTIGAKTPVLDDANKIKA